MRKSTLGRSAGVAISNEGKRPGSARRALERPLGLIASALCFFALIDLAGCGSDSAGPALQSVQVSPSSGALAAGTTRPLQATALFSDGTHQDVTAQARWSSSDTAVVTLSSSATESASGLTPGSARISATFNGMTGTASLTVTPAVLISLAVSPAAASVASGYSLQFTATGIFSDNSKQNLTAQVKWASTAASVATISNAAGSQGVASAANPGAATITATSGNIVGTAPLTVTAAVLTQIQVTPATPSLAAGLSLSLTATGIFSNHTTQNLTSQVSWSSGAGGIASVGNAPSSAGVLTGVTQGVATISATLGSMTGSTRVTITAATLTALSVTPAQPTVADGLGTAFTATGLFSDHSTQNLTTQVTWISASPSVATVSNASGSNGVARTLTPGTTAITAQLGAVISPPVTLTVTHAALVSIQVTPAAQSIALGTSVALTATGLYTDNSTQNLTTQVTWSSSDPAVASVDNSAPSSGLATSVATGTTGVTAALGSIISPVVTLTVTPATLASLNVTPANASIANGLTEQFTAIGIYTDNSTQNLTGSVIWSASGSNATISNATGSQGLASTNGTGSVTITAQSGSISGSTTLNVTAATLVSIAVTPAAQSIPSGLTEQFSATGTYTDNSTQDLTTTVAWSSSSSAVSVSNATGSQGLASTSGVGSATISAQSGAVTGSTTLTVTPATLLSLQVTPVNPTVTLGATQQFTATGTYTDSSTQNLSSSVTWSSSDTSVATVSNVAGSNGMVSVSAGAALGATSVISASSAAISGQTTLTAGTVGYLYVAAQGSNVIACYAIGAGGVLIGMGSAPTAPGPVSLAADPTGRFLYAANFSWGEITEYTIGTTGQLTEIAGIDTASPWSVAVDASGQYVYAANRSDNTVSQFVIQAGGTLAANGSIATGATPYAVASDPNGPYLYVANLSSDNLYAYAIGAGGALNLIGTYLTGGQASAVTVDPSGTFVYALDWGANSVAEFTIGADGTLSEQGSIGSGDLPFAIAVAPGTQYAYVVNQRDNTVSQYSIAANGALAVLSPPTVSTGIYPTSVAVDPSGSYLYTANQSAATLSQYAIGAGGGLIPLSPATVSTDNGPTSIITVRAR